MYSVQIASMPQNPIQTGYIVCGW